MNALLVIKMTFLEFAILDGMDGHAVVRMVPSLNIRRSYEDLSGHARMKSERCHSLLLHLEVMQ